MPATHNPFKPGDEVRVKRGDRWLPGVCTSVRLSTVFVQLEDSRLIVQDHYNDVKREDGVCVGPTSKERRNGSL